MNSVLARIRRIGNWVRGSLDTAGARRSALRIFDGPHKRQSEKLLFVAFFDPKGLKTILENIEEWCKQSRYRFDLLNLFDFPGRRGLAIPGWLDLEDYTGILVHCTTSYNPDNLISLDANLGTKISDYEGLKILMKQDEHYRAAHVANFLKSRRFDLLITLVEPQHIREIYPAQQVGDVGFLHAKTAYVSRQLRGLKPPLLAARPIDVGYRGSIQPFNFGTLAYEKREIGDRFGAVCQEHGLACDISSRWEDRFLGNRWLDFLCRIKATLGAESGASIVDFDGAVEQACEEYLRTHPHAEFPEIYEKVLRMHDNNAYYRAISPRHLEAAACRTTQVLYEGDYSGMLRADRHYIPLRRDFANAEAVVSKVRDLPYCQDMVDRAFEEVVLNPRYSYETFLAEFDGLIAQMLVSGGRGR